MGSSLQDSDVVCVITCQNSLHLDDLDKEWQLIEKSFSSEVFYGCQELKLSKNN